MTASTVPAPARRRATLALALLPLAALGGCAGFGAERVRVTLVGIEPLSAQLLEVRLLARLRVLNPNDTPIEYESLFASLSLRGSEVAAGVIGERGTIPRYGDAIVAVPLSVSALGVIRPLLGLAAGAAGGTVETLPYELRGNLRLAGIGRVPFSMSGELDPRSWVPRAGGRG